MSPDGRYMLHWRAEGEQSVSTAHIHRMTNVRYSIRIGRLKRSRRDIPKSQLARKGSARPSTDCVWIFTISCLHYNKWISGSGRTSLARARRTGIARQAKTRWIMYQKRCSVGRLEASLSSRVAYRRRWLFDCSSIRRHGESDAAGTNSAMAAVETLLALSLIVSSK